jgi:hypothetical protein
MDVLWQKLLVIAAAVVFAVYLLFKYRPTFPLPRLPRRRRSERPSPEQTRFDVQKEREKARTAKTPRERATSLLLAAEAAAEADDGITSAMGLYLRSMRADATFCDPIRGISALLRSERPELLETVLWRRLAHLRWSGETVPATKCVVESLVSLYRRELRHRDRAKALQKLIAKLSA